MLEGCLSLALTIVADIVPPKERAKYQGMFLAVFGTSSVLGPVVGGAHLHGAGEILFIDGWRWIFLMNIRNWCRLTVYGCDLPAHPA